MKEFNYTINNAMGLHARPAGLMVKIIASHTDSVKIEFKGKVVDAKRLYQVLSLGVKTNEEIKVTVDGETEEETINEIRRMFETENL
ncbi:MAG: HPr family phosphocarrier protein [Candidatus Izemoplasmatales bacterium]|jgi:phosphocarrier protein|nr:HPr family phosphocarrier protein [Candidatus Izemoplasmatales bacterium]